MIRRPIKSADALLGQGPDDYQMRQIRAAWGACDSLTTMLVGIERLELGTDTECGRILHEAVRRIAECEAALMTEVDL